MMLPPEVAKQLGHYVYLLVDPRSGQIFYVGKGVGDRFAHHLTDTMESRKTKIIGELKAEGLEPTIDVLAHQLPDEKTALLIEAAAIDVLGLANLANEVRGWNSVQFGRMNLSQLRSLYEAPAANIIDDVVLLRISQLYQHDMTAPQLYEATRGVWIVSSRRNKARFACAVFESIVREVYAIERWQPANTTPYATRPLADVAIPSRWEFVGSIAPPEIRARYINHSVRQYLTGTQGAVRYINCKRR